MTIALRQGMSEDENFDAESTWSKTNSSIMFGISISKNVRWQGLANFTLASIKEIS